MNRIYLDNCATTAVAPQVAETMTSVLTNTPGNPSSIHYEGQQAARVAADARAIVANSLAARPAEIVFTSSGTEANNLAIAGTIGRAIRAHGRAQVITSTVEHASVATRLDWEKRQHGDKLEICPIGVDSNGLLRLDELDACLQPDTTLVALLLANNETGVLQNLDELKRRKLALPTVPWLLDCVQVQTKLDLDMRLLPFEMLSFSAHKIYGPKGIGALYVRGGTDLDPLIVGGSQEKYRRAGTENVAAIAGYARAVQIAPPAHEIWSHLLSLENAFLNQLNADGTQFTINGPAEPGDFARQSPPPQRLPGFLNLSLANAASREDLQIAMDLEGVSLSSTSACHSGVVEESHVLKAMNLTGERLTGAIRVLFSRQHTIEEATQAARRLATVWKRIAPA